MKIKLLDGKKFYRAFQNGASVVDKNKSHLNKINFFPVPDNDTGSNMSYTLVSTAARVTPDKSIYNTLESISDYIVKSARGNSGLIMAQFFNGLHKKMSQKNTVTTKDFADDVKNTVPYLYENVGEPVEGTMLTVIKDWSEKLPELAENIDDFVILFEHSLETARKSLEQTKYQLQVHQEYNTVDAGAQGFVYFLEGVLNSWHKIEAEKSESENMTDQIEDDNASRVDVPQSELDKLSFRYCTEILLQGDISGEKIKPLLVDKGDSLQVASSGSSTRVHIHTDDPAGVVYLLRDKGRILEQKVDDMLRQLEMSHAGKNDTALVTDSIADIPREVLDKYGIHMIPLNILIDGTNYLDKLTIKPKYFYEYLEEAEEFPSSSQPGVDFIYDYLEKLAGYYDSIFIISVSEKLSGTGRAFKQAIARLEADRDIKINYLDSQLNSGAQGLLVIKAAEELAAGKSPETVEKTIKKYRKKSQIFVNVNDFDYMVRGGRVSAMKGFFAKLLNLKPIIALDEDGDGDIKGKALTKRGVRRKINKYVKQIAAENRIEKYALVHARAPQLMQDWQQEIESILNFSPSFSLHVSSITALNSGPGTVGLSILVEGE